MYVSIAHLVEALHDLSPGLHVPGRHGGDLGAALLDQLRPVVSGALRTNQRSVLADVDQSEASIGPGI